MAKSVGRPRKYDSPEQMQAAIDKYFDETEDDELTITGLALALDFTSRKDLINYEGYSEEYYHTLKKAKLRIENTYEKALRKHGRSGDIFALKNFDWADKIEQDINASVGVKEIKITDVG
jgi:hypothetical protein